MTFLRRKKIKKYKLPSKTVEAHNGTFKRIYHYDDIPITGLERVQNLMFTIGAKLQILWVDIFLNNLLTI